VRTGNGLQLRILLVPDPGAPVDPIDKLDVEESREIDDLTARHDDDRASQTVIDRNRGV